MNRFSPKELSPPRGRKKQPHSMQVAVYVAPSEESERARDTRDRLAPPQEDWAHATGVLTVSPDQQTVMAPDATLQSLMRFDFDQIWTGRYCVEPLTGYHVKPLVDDVVEGKSALFALFGENDAAKNEFMEATETTNYGLLLASAGRLFSCIEGEGISSSRNEWETTVRISWYEIRNDRIIDLLSISGGEGPGKDLQFRDDPQVGCVVPGLWEVQISGAQDLAKVISSVRKKIPSSASEGTHSVIVFNVQQTSTSTQHQKKTKSPRVSQLSFLHMGNASAVDSTQPDGVQKWVRALQEVLQGLEIRAPVVPWASSKLTTLLRDPMCGKIPSVLLTYVDSNIDSVASTSASLKFASRIFGLQERNAIDRNESKRSLSSARGQSSSSLGERAVAAVQSSPRGGRSSPYSPQSADQQQFGFQQGIRHEEFYQQSSIRTQESYGENAPPDGRKRSPQRIAKILQDAATTGAANGLKETPSVTEAEHVASKMYSLAEKGDSSAKWFTAMLSALESSREEVQQLQHRLHRTVEELQEVKGERNRLDEQLRTLQQELQNADIPLKARDQIRQLRKDLKSKAQEVRDYELYRDVMESTMSRLKGEVTKLVEDRDAAQRSAKSAQQSARKEREEASNYKRAYNQLAADMEGLQAQNRRLNQRCRKAEAMVEQMTRQPQAASQEGELRHDQRNVHHPQGDREAKARLARYAKGKDDTQHTNSDSPGSAYQGHSTEKYSQPSYTGDMDDESLLNAVRGTAEDVLHAVHEANGHQHNEKYAAHSTPQERMPNKNDALVQGLKAEMSQQGDNRSRSSSRKSNRNPEGGRHAAQRSTSRRK